MDLTNLILLTIRFPYYKKINLPTIEIIPFEWYIIPNIHKYDRGEYNDFTIHFLFIKVYQRFLSKKGIANKKYRKSLKQSKL